MVNGIHHPRFIRINKTDYTMNNPANFNRELLHVGQVAKYLLFDKALRDGKSINGLTGIPTGYDTFAKVFNEGTHPRDGRRLSTITFTQTGVQRTVSNNPVTLQDFVITPEQCGLSPIKRNLVDDAESYVFKEYATSMALQSRRRKEAIQLREAKRREPYSKSFGKRQKPHNNSHYDDDQTSNVYFDSIDQSSHATTSRQVSEVPASQPEIPLHSVAFYTADQEPDPVPDFINAIINMPDDAIPEIPQETSHEFEPVVQPEEMQE
jgi:hypothetical protein